MQTNPIEISSLTAEVFQKLGLTNPTARQTDLMRAVFNHLVEQRELHFDTRLSAREKVCLQLLAQGKSLEEIGVTMHIKRTTVATFIKRIKKKLKCDTLPQAVFRGIKDT
jgi:DNA-binding CsgD family transcriptional regulator